MPVCRLDLKSVSIYLAQLICIVRQGRVVDDRGVYRCALGLVDVIQYSCKSMFLLKERGPGGFCGMCKLMPLGRFYGL